MRPPHPWPSPSPCPRPWPLASGSWPQALGTWLTGLTPWPSLVPVHAHSVLQSTRPHSTCTCPHSTCACPRYMHMYMPTQAQPVDAQTLTCNGVELDDDRATLASYNVSADEAVLTLVVPQPPPPPPSSPPVAPLQEARTPEPFGFLVIKGIRAYDLPKVQMRMCTCTHDMRAHGYARPARPPARTSCTHNARLYACLHRRTGSPSRTLTCDSSPAMRSARRVTRFRRSTLSGGMKSACSSGRLRCCDVKA